jgi:hypothetical protein
MMLRMAGVVALASAWLAAGASAEVSIAAGDITGDGVDDVIVAPHEGFASHVKVFDGVTQTEIRAFFAFPPSFTGGVNLAAGDIDRDGIDDIIVASRTQTAHVKVFSGKSGAEIASFLPAPEAKGAGVAFGEADGSPVIVVSLAGATGQIVGHVVIYDGATLKPTSSFLAYPPAVATTPPKPADAGKPARATADPVRR